MSVTCPVNVPLPVWPMPCRTQLHKRRRHQRSSCMADARRACCTRPHSFCRFPYPIWRKPQVSGVLCGQSVQTVAHHGNLPGASRTCSHCPFAASKHFHAVTSVNLGGTRTVAGRVDKCLVFGSAIMVIVRHLSGKCREPGGRDRSRPQCTQKSTTIDSLLLTTGESYCQIPGNQHLAFRSPLKNQPCRATKSW